MDLIYTCTIKYMRLPLGGSCIANWNDNKLILWYLEICGLFMRLVWTPTLINIILEHINHFNDNTMLTTSNDFMLRWHDIMYVILFDVSCESIIDVGSILANWRLSVGHTQRTYTMIKR